MIFSKLKHKPPRQPLPNLVDINCLKLATEVTEKNPDLPSHVWKNGKTRVDSFDAGLEMAIQGVPVVATGLWAVALEQALYARLLGQPAEVKMKAAVEGLFRVHRFLYRKAMTEYQSEFVGLSPKRTLRIMKLTLADLENHNG